LISKKSGSPGSDFAPEIDGDDGNKNEEFSVKNGESGDEEEVEFDDIEVSLRSPKSSLAIGLANSEDYNGLQNNKK
jgi:hypothetical protein